MHQRMHVAGPDGSVATQEREQHDPAPRVRRRATMRVGAANDPAEREADLVADRVSRWIESGGGVPAATAARVASGGVRRRAAGEPAPIGPEGGDVDRAVEQRIERARGGGSALPADLRRTMGEGLGADLGGVRVHTGGEADSLNRSLGAQAFTVGSDVFFASGQYQPGDTAGRHLLAHELAHTVQQTGGASRSPASGRIRRSPVRVSRKLAAAPATNWGAATTAYASEGGGGGVLFVDDGSGDPVVLKAGEEADLEAMMASRIHGKMFGGKGGVVSPGARIVPTNEASGIKAALEPKVVANPKSKPDNHEWSIKRAKRILNDTNRPGVMVYDRAKGVDFKDLAEGKQTQSSGFLGLGKRKAKEGTALGYLGNRDFGERLGRVAVSDIFTANFDRLVGLLNFENFMVAQDGTISLIDNIFMSDNGFNLRDMPQFQVTRDGAEAAWKNHPAVTKLRNDDFAGIATPIVNKIIAEFTKSDDDLDGASKDEKKTAAQNAKVAASMRPKLLKNISDGIKTGKKELLATLHHFSDMINDLPDDQRKDVRKQYAHRRDYLAGK